VETDSKKNEDMLVGDRGVVWGFAELSGGEVSSMKCEMHGNCCDPAVLFQTSTISDCLCSLWSAQVCKVSVKGLDGL